MPEADTAPDARPVVLLIDDEAIILRSVSRVLERGGYRVVTASTGEAAVAACRCGVPAMSKPFSAADLLAAVWEICPRSAPSRSSEGYRRVAS